jgi:ATP-dependent Lhr-like helicase
VIWVGREGLGEHDGRVSLYLAEHAPLLLPGPPPDAPDGQLHQRIREHLGQRGASFFQQILLACSGAYQADVQDALWDLVWSGEVTNDTLAPLRAFVSPKRRIARRGSLGRPGRRTGVLFPPELSGRWSLVSSFLYRTPSPTERLAARTRQLLDRTGVLTREAVAAEGIEGGFSAVYPILKTMEEAGQIRRGYFVAGLGATQFALPGAVDRLRGLRQAGEEPEAVVLAATDPANPYGAALPWPAPPEAEGEEGKTGRRAALAAWMGRAERNLLAFLDAVPDRDAEDTAVAVAEALARQIRPGGRRAVFVTEVNGKPAQETLMGPALLHAGFTFGPRGYMKRL